MRASHGFTLIELLVVIALIAIGTAAVSFSLRDSAQTVLERDAERLANLFESARARSRASGMPVKWYPQTTDNNRGDPDASSHHHPSTQRRGTEMDLLKLGSRNSNQRSKF